ncbi:MAG: UTP--glucose-1-phosphate uridylyltransferase, partial [Pirellulaceae bacterium]
MDNQVFNELDSLLAAYNQQQLLCCWDQLDQLQQSELARQVREIDLEQLAALKTDRNNESRELSQQIAPPPAIRPGHPRRADLPAESVEEAIALGEAALRDGRVALILVAGGQASRLGLNGPKALFPIGPLSGRSLLQFSIDRLKVLADRYDSEIPLLIMTSPSVHEAISGFLAEHNNFGLSAENCQLFCQGTMPAVDIDSGRILLETPGSLALSPDGHGGMVEALGRSSCLQVLAERQIDTISYVQVDNPLAQACDPGLIGFHLAANSEMTSQAVQKNDSLEKTGNIVAVDDHLEVVEYSELPESLARKIAPDGRLRFWAGSI